MSNASGMAPVCNINPPPKPPAAAAPYLPAFVQADVQNPQSIVSAITQLQFALIAITGNNVPNNIPIELSPLNVVANNPPPGRQGGGGTVGGGGGGGSSGKGKKSTKNPKQVSSRFVEQHRTTKMVKVTNPQDTTQYVMVKQITALTMYDKITRESWVWKQ